MSGSGKRPLADSHTEAESPQLPNSKIIPRVVTKIGDVTFERDKNVILLTIRREYPTNAYILDRDQIEDLIAAAQEFLVAIKEEEEVKHCPCCGQQ